ncbi:MAG: hypothetical protein ACREU6_10430 [Steroidobacteraceae bacterium]
MTALRVAPLRLNRLIPRDILCCETSPVLTAPTPGQRIRLEIEAV